MSQCRFLDRSPEAYRVSPDGDREPIDVYLCGWADQHPERFIDAPRWISRPAIGSLAIQPEHDCAGCPGYALAGAK